MTRKSKPPASNFRPALPRDFSFRVGQHGSRSASDLQIPDLPTNWRIGKMTIGSIEARASEDGTAVPFIPSIVDDADIGDWNGDRDSFITTERIRHGAAMGRILLVESIRRPTQADAVAKGDLPFAVMVVSGSIHISWPADPADGPKVYWPVRVVTGQGQIAPDTEALTPVHDSRKLFPLWQPGARSPA